MQKTLSRRKSRKIETGNEGVNGLHLAFLEKKPKEGNTQYDRHVVKLYIGTGRFTKLVNL